MHMIVPHQSQNIYVSYTQRMYVSVQGDACPYSHEQIVEPCQQLVLSGICQFGQNCNFSHDSLPEYVVEPLQEWFREQQQVKKDRTAKEHIIQLQTAANNHVIQPPFAANSNTQTAQALSEDTPPGAAVACLPYNIHKSMTAATSEHSHQESRLHADSNEPSLQLTVRAERYQSWTDGWQRVFANRLQDVKQSKQVQDQHHDTAALHPLQAPYTTWQDGWNRLFATQKQTNSK